MLLTCPPFFFPGSGGLKFAAMARLLAISSLSMSSGRLLSSFCARAIAMRAPIG